MAVPRLTSVSPTRFFALTYLLSWAVWVPLVLSHFEVGPFRVPESTSVLVRLLGVLMPATAALLLTLRSGGRAEVRALLSRLTLWRVGARWWVAAVVVQPALLVVAVVGANALAGSAVVAPSAMDPATLAVTIVFLLVAVLGEEIGWRGVALPALQQRMDVRAAALVLGVLWAAWHLPFWLLLDSFALFGPVYLLLNLLFIVPSNVFITWFVNGARFSLLLPVAFHLAFNIVNTALLPATMDLTAFTILIALNAAIGALLLPRLRPGRGCHRGVPPVRFAHN